MTSYSKIKNQACYKVQIIYENRKFSKTNIVFILSSLGLVGCGGGGTDNTTNTNINLPSSGNLSLLTGSVVKGPLNNALVFADYNGDGKLSPNEPSTRTSADGSFSLQSAIPSAGFVAIADESTTDTFTNSPITGVTLKAPAGATVVTPATTLFVEVKEKNPEIKTTDLASALGLEDINILEFNPFSSDADPEKALTAEKVSSQIITTLTSISAAGEGAGASQEVAYEKALEAVTSVVSAKIQSNVSDDSSAINDNNETKNIDFSDNSLLSEVSIAAKNELSSVVVSEDALNKVLDDSVGAIKNVNQKIDTATNLTDKESVAAFTVTSELKEQVKVAAKSELQNPGSSKIEFSDIEAVETTIITNTPNVVITDFTKLSEDIKSSEDNDVGSGSESSSSPDSSGSNTGGSGSGTGGGTSVVQTESSIVVNLGSVEGNFFIEGSDLNDNIVGSLGIDTINAGAGDDIITIATAGKGDSDMMDGGADADVLQLSKGVHTFGDDDKLANIEKIATHADGSEVVVSAQTEAFEITGGAGVDTITGGKGNDTINAGAGVDTIIGGEGDDIITGGADNDILTGGAGNDTFKIDSGFDTITDLSGSDILIVSSGATVSASGIDAFTATSNTKNDGTANLTTDNDGGTINMASSSSGAFIITGGAGDDTLVGNGGSDKIYGMGGADTITGNAGTDTIVAGDGDDIIIVASAGDSNSDIIDGGGGNDTLQLSVGSHTLNNDARIQNVQTITLNASGTTINLDGQTEGLTISGGNGDDNITSGSGSDIINAGSGSDIIYGKVGSDTISLGDNDNATDTIIMDITDGLDLIKQFKAGSTNGDIFKYTGNLNDVESSQNLSNGSNGTDEILSDDFISQSKNASLDIVNLVIGFQTGVTQNGLSSGSAIDFTGAGIFSSQILGYIESALENKNDGGGSGLLSGQAGQQVLQGDANEIKLLLCHDAGVGAAVDTAIVLYNEGVSSESDFSGELSLLAIVQGITVSDLTHDNFYG